MEYISVIQFAEKYGISERTARNYCAAGKIDGAFLTGKTWNIPADADLPKKGKKKLIYQTPWYEDDKTVPAGLVEFSIILPENMPHYDRG